jgi:hypothetical protein
VSARQGVIESCAIAWLGTHDAGGDDPLAATDDVHVERLAGE